MKKKLIKTIILILAIIGLYDVTTCSVMLYPEHKIHNDFRYSGPITAEELDSFLPIWKDFLVEYADSAGVSEVSLTPKLPSDAMPLKMKLWLKNRDWNVNRFFIVEQRLRDIVNYIYIKRHAKEVIEVMTTALETEKDPAMRENIQNVIASQNEILNSNKANNPETLLIESRLDDIIKVIEN